MIRRRSRSSRRIVPTKRSAIAFARGARTGVVMILTSAAVKTASKATVKLLVGAENTVTSCDLHVLVYQAAESISSQRPECSSGRRGSGACGRLLIVGWVWID